MSVMSAAEARQVAGASPEIPSQPLRIARSTASRSDPAAAGSPVDVGEEAWAEPGAVDRSVSALRVTRVRMLREVRVSTLRAAQSRPGTVPQPRADVADQARVAKRARAAGQTGAASQARVTTQTRVASQAKVASQARVASHNGVASQARVASQTEVTSQARISSQTRVAAEKRVTGHARLAGQARVVGQPGVVQPPGPVRRPGPVRLTRRGRRVVAGLVIGVIIVGVTVLWMTAAGSVQASSQGSTPQGSPYRGMTQVVVRPGQTLWSIASAAEPSSNLWAVVQQIINVNALSGASVQAGQLLWVPRS
jgi:LysM domain